ncbi:MAG: hypothetical protein M0R68_03950 [Bacteroidetes bacterium]|nr:hypothetical protein [Bacteroidota bacterium]
MIYETVTDLVNEKFATSMQFAEDSSQTVTDLLASLSQVAIVPQFVDEALDIPTISAGLSDLTMPAAPQLSALSGQLPVTPALTGYDPVDVDLPTFGIDAPTLNTITAPTLDTYVAPAVPSINTDIDLPAPISLDQIAEPIMAEVLIPTVPSMELPALPTPDVPQFTAEFGPFAFDPSTVFAEIDAALLFLNDSVSGTAAILVDLINNPRMAISDAVKLELIARDRQKLADEYALRQTEVIDTWSARGWDAPTGVMLGQLSTLDRLRYISEDNVMRDYTIKDWELAQQNWQAAVSALPQYSSSLVQLTSSILAKTLETAKYAFEAAMNRYQAAIEVYKQNIDVYKTAYAVYELQIKAQSFLLDVYNAQVTGAKLQLDVNNAGLDLYKTKLSAQITKVEVYKAVVESALAKLNLSKTQVELYKAQVDGFLAGLTANTTKVQLYREQMSGEKTKLDVYGSQIANYTALLDAAKVQSTIQLEQTKNVLEANKLKVLTYEADIKRYGAEMDTIVETNKAAVSLFAGNVGLYEADTRKVAAYAELLVKEGEVNARIQEARIDTKIKQAEINISNANIAVQVQLEAMKAAANIAAQMVASSLSAVSAGAHLGASSSANESWTHAD